MSRFDRLHWFLLAMLAWLGSAAACGHAAGTTETTATTPVAKPAPKPKRVPSAAPEPPASATIGDAMADHFLIASWSRDVVIAGALDPLREPLHALADYRYDEIRPGGWLRWIAQLQTAARLAASAENLDTAAMGVATMSRICGECHLANGAGPKVPPQLPRIEPMERDDLSGRMFRHMWAATLLWQGITTPSDVAWNDGVRELQAAPAQLDEALPVEFDADLREVHALAEQANEATTLAQRADVYGLLLATCAGCHDRWVDHGIDPHGGAEVE